VDVWSVGCIFAELLNMQAENCPDPSKREPLFPGEACGDFSDEFASAAAKEKRRQRGREQLDLILKVLGTPHGDDLDFLDQHTSERIKRAQPRPAEDLHGRFPGAGEEAVSLLRAMLQFSPQKRVTVEDALEHSFFASVRQREREVCVCVCVFVCVCVCLCVCV